VETSWIYTLVSSSFTEEHAHRGRFSEEQAVSAVFLAVTPTGARPPQARADQALLELRLYLLTEPASLGA
jgi:hypothetical protein